ncbi:MAG: DsrE family protein [bacterium]
MYALNAKKLGWWQEVTLIIWGASARLAGHDELIQLKLKELLSSGIRIEACKACASDLGVENILKDLGVDVKYWGQQLTALLKDGKKLITI